LNRETEQAKVTLILGGARSGKSTLAEKLAHVRAGEQAGVLYVATMLAYDDEMGERVIRHRASRPASWRTVEAPYSMTEEVMAGLQGERLVLVDCLTAWTSNWMLREIGIEGQGGEISEDEQAGAPATENTDSDSQDRLDPKHPEREVRPPDYSKLETMLVAELESLVAQLRERNTGLILVSNEVGMGLVPPYPLGRAYRDLLGKVNQRLARLADEAFMVFAGLPIELKRLQAELGTIPFK
jgi:adenosylcobinamide kinase / adenosylcobinamide-phosphate guanylyltransferase